MDGDLARHLHNLHAASSFASENGWSGSLFLAWLCTVFAGPDGDL